MIIIILALITISSASNEQSAEVKEATRCQEITIPMCKSIRYNYTEMPNSFNHETQEETGLEVHQYWPLVEINCSDDLRFFICSLYVPICMEDYAGTVPPCRSVCERARAGCEPVMTHYGFIWPERMSCDQFPKFGKNSICMDEKSGEMPDSKKLDTTKIGGSSVIIKPIGEKSGGSGLVNQKPECSNQCKCEYPMVSLEQAGHKHHQNVVHTGPTPNCLFPCRGYGYSNQEEIRFANYWLTFWSCFTCSLSTLTILTFLIDSTRFNYPERPIICISLCYVFVSIGYLIRLHYGHSEIACGGPNSPVIRYPGFIFTNHNQSNSPTCTLVFLLTYYFTIAGSCWYVVLTITWYLASVLKWGTEAISNKSSLFHSTVWVSSAILSLSVLLTDSIDGDSISGICFVGNQDYRNLVVFVLAPMGGLLVLGGVFLVSGFVALVKIRSVIVREVRNFHKLEKLMIRIGVFGVLYTVNVVCVVGGYLYEAWVREQWVTNLNCGCGGGGGKNRPAYSVLMIKYFMTLATGITSSIWVFSSKTIDTWKRFLLQLLFCSSSNNSTSSQHSIINQNKQTHV